MFGHLSLHVPGLFLTLLLVVLQDLAIEINPPFAIFMLKMTLSNGLHELWNSFVVHFYLPEDDVVGRDSGLDFFSCNFTLSGPAVLFALVVVLKGNIPGHIAYFSYFY